MRSRQAAAAAGVKGGLFTLRDAEGAAGGRVRLSLDYGSFAYAYGGDYAARLHLVELPGCGADHAAGPGLPGPDRPRLVR